MRRSTEWASRQLSSPPFSALRTLAILSLFASVPSHGQTANFERDAWIHKVTFVMGAGGTLVLGNTSKDLNPGFNFITGLGYRVHPRLVIPLDLLLSSGGLPTSILRREQQPNGRTGLFTVALDPSYIFLHANHWDGYLTGGGGISIKQVVFTHPSTVDSYSYGYNAEAASESSVQPAVDIGVGVSYRMHPDSTIQFFQEARYLNIFTPKGQFPGFNQAGTSLLLLTLGFRL